MTSLKTRSQERDSGVKRRGPGPRLRSRPQGVARGDALAAWVLIGPSFVLFVTFVLVPTIGGVALAFTSWNFYSPIEWIGLDNFTRLFRDASAWQSLGVTMAFIALGVVPTIIMGFLIAVLINVNRPGVGILRVLYFVPVVISVAVSSVLWAFLYDPRQGPFGALARMLGMTPSNPLTSTTLSLPALVLMMIWLALPIVILLYLAGLQRVPVDIYSAAALDGVGKWRMIWSMTWPNVRSTTAIVAVLQIVNFSASSLDVALIMTNGGPLDATRVLGLYAYQEAFFKQDIGYASALSVLQLIVILALIGAGRLVMRRFAR